MPKIISLNKESREKHHYSESEGLILIALYGVENGIRTAELKSIILHLNSHDLDEAEEALESLKNEALITNKKERWILTEDGKGELDKMVDIREQELEENEESD